MTQCPSDFPESGISSIALMVCSYQRPELLANFLRSLSQVNVPPGVDLHVVVADNNPESHYERYIAELLQALPFPASYGHEPETGYSNARNKALELALKTPAELLAFVDDDMAPDPDWLLGHLQSHEAFGCDVVGGAIHGRKAGHEHGRRFAHGEFCSTMGTTNVSFKRWLVDGKEGLGLRFDPRFNKTGREDKAFFSQAHAQGAGIVFSKLPVVHDTMSGKGWREELKNKAVVSAIMQRNAIVSMRQERGFPAALAGVLWGVTYGLKGVASYADHAASRLLGLSVRSDRKRLSAYKNRLKMTEGFKGLSGDYVARYEVRRSL